MGNEVNISQLLVDCQPKFNRQNAFGLKFESECLFAKQQLMKNDFTLRTAANNQGSLQAAILNVAAIGISLNPALTHAYLVPRDGAVCLDISYRGLVKLATDSGAIKWAKAVLVYEGDEFVWRGPNEAPKHEADVFDEKRIDAANPLQNIKGGYCIAKLTDGDVLVEVMTAGEILAVKETSKAKAGPWAGKWAGEMAKKTLVKRAYKSWPQSDGRERLDTAIEILNQHEGLEDEPIRTGEFLRPSKEQTETYLALAKDGEPVDFWIWFQAQDDRIRASLPGCTFERGQKQKMMAFFEAQLKAGRETFNTWAADLLALCESDDSHGVVEFMGEMTEAQREALLATLNTTHRYYVEQTTLEAA